MFRSLKQCVCLSRGKSEDGLLNLVELRCIISFWRLYCRRKSKGERGCGAGKDCWGADELVSRGNSFLLKSEHSTREHQEGRRVVVNSVRVNSFAVRAQIEFLDQCCLANCDQ